MKYELREIIVAASVAIQLIEKIAKLSRKERENHPDETSKMYQGLTCSAVFAEDALTKLSFGLEQLEQCIKEAGELCPSPTDPDRWSNKEGLPEFFGG